MMKFYEFLELYGIEIDDLKEEHEQTYIRWYNDKPVDNIIKAVDEFMDGKHGGELGFTKDSKNGIFAWIANTGKRMRVHGDIYQYIQDSIIIDVTNDKTYTDDEWAESA